MIAITSNYKFICTYTHKLNWTLMCCLADEKKLWNSYLAGSLLSFVFDFCISIVGCLLLFSYRLWVKQRVGPPFSSPPHSVKSYLS